MTNIHSQCQVLFQFANSASPSKVEIQGRDTSWVQKPFFACFDPDANWLDQLNPAFDEENFFFEEGYNELQKMLLPMIYE